MSRSISTGRAQRNVDPTSDEWARCAAPVAETVSRRVHDVQLIADGCGFLRPRSRALQARLAPDFVDVHLEQRQADRLQTTGEMFSSSTSRAGRPWISTMKFRRRGER